MARIAVLTGDVLGARMAGPAIRALNIADQLSTSHEVTLVSTASSAAGRPLAGPVPGVVDQPGRGHFRMVTVERGGLRGEVASADVLVIQGSVSLDAPWLLRTDKVVVVDLYDPVHLEQLEQSRDLTPRRRQLGIDLTVRILNEQLLRGDFLLCASEDQRRLWLGHLAALGRVNVDTHGQDPTLRSLLAVCPFGLPAAVPEGRGHPVRAGLGLGADAKVALWAGGVYDWLDPLTAIRAVGRLSSRRPEVALVFLGMGHPNRGVTMTMPERCRRLSDELGLTGKNVFFKESWVEYDERQSYLLDADVGLTTHREHLESLFSFRSRVLDHLWTGRPVVTSDGDAMAALVRERGLGAVVPPGDVDALADALETLLYDQSAWSSAAANVVAARGDFTWDRTLAPLVEFCAEPRRAADSAQDRARLVRRPVLPARALPRLAARAGLVLRRGGLREAGARGWAMMRRSRP